MNAGVVARKVLAVPAFSCLASCALNLPGDETYRVEMTARTPEEPATVPVVLFADNLHTGLILSLPWIKRHGYVPPEGTPDHAWVTFSWGDETAYVEERWLNPAQVARALFLPSESVMEIITFDWYVAEVCRKQRLYQTFVPDSAGAALADYLNRCAVRGPDGRPETIGPSSWGEGRLIRSNQVYYFPRICNVWTVEALNAAGFDLNRATGLSADGVIRQATGEKNGFHLIWAPRWRMEEGKSPR